jgi:hypothetical protein
LITKDAFGTDRGTAPDIGAHEVELQLVDTADIIVKGDFCGQCPIKKMVLPEGAIIKNVSVKIKLSLI